MSTANSPRLPWEAFVPLWCDVSGAMSTIAASAVCIRAMEGPANSSAEALGEGWYSISKVKLFGPYKGQRRRLHVLSPLGHAFMSVSKARPTAKALTKWQSTSFSSAKQFKQNATGQTSGLRLIQPPAWPLLDTVDVLAEAGQVMFPGPGGSTVGVLTAYRSDSVQAIRSICGIDRDGSGDQDSVRTDKTSSIDDPLGGKAPNRATGNTAFPQGAAMVGMFPKYLEGKHPSMVVVHTQVEAAAAQLCCERVSHRDGHQAVCCGCGYGGKLVLCDSCYQSWHATCDPDSRLRRRVLPSTSRWDCGICRQTRALRIEIGQMTRERCAAGAHLGRHFVAMAEEGVLDDELRVSEALSHKEESGACGGAGDVDGSASGSALSIPMAASAAPKPPSIRRATSDASSCRSAASVKSRLLDGGATRAASESRHGTRSLRVSKPDIDLAGDGSETGSMNGRADAESAAESAAGDALMISKANSALSTVPALLSGGAWAGLQCCHKAAWLANDIDMAMLQQQSASSEAASSHSKSVQAPGSGQAAHLASKKRARADAAAAPAAASGSEEATVTGVESERRSPPCTLPVPMSYREIFLRILLELLDSRDTRGYSCAAVCLFRPFDRRWQNAMRQIGEPRMWLNDIICASLQSPSTPAIETCIPGVQSLARGSASSAPSLKHTVSSVKDEDDGDAAAGDAGADRLTGEPDGTLSPTYSESSSRGKQQVADTSVALMGNKRRRTVETDASVACDSSASSTGIDFHDAQDFHAAVALLRGSIDWWQSKYTQFSTPNRHASVLVGVLSNVPSDLLGLRRQEQELQAKALSALSHAHVAESSGSSVGLTLGAEASRGACRVTQVLRSVCTQVSFGEVLSTQDIISRGASKAHIPWQPDPSHVWNATEAAGAAASNALKSISSKLRFELPYAEFAKKHVVLSVNGHSSLRASTQRRSSKYKSAIEACALDSDEEAAHNEQQSAIPIDLAKSNAAVVQPSRRTKAQRAQSDHEKTTQRKSRQRSKPVLPRMPAGALKIASGQSKAERSNANGGRVGAEINDSGDESYDEDGDCSDIGLDVMDGGGGPYEPTDEPGSLGFVAQVPMLRGLRYLGQDPPIAERIVGLMSPLPSESSASGGRDAGTSGFIATATAMSQPGDTRGLDLPAFDGSTGPETVFALLSTQFSQQGAFGRDHLLLQQGEVVQSMNSRVCRIEATRHELIHFGLSATLSASGLGEAAAQRSCVRLCTASRVAAVPRAAMQMLYWSGLVDFKPGLERLWYAHCLRYGSNLLCALSGPSPTQEELDELDAQDDHASAVVHRMRERIMQAFFPDVSCSGRHPFDDRNDGAVLASIRKLTDGGHGSQVLSPGNMHKASSVLTNDEVSELPTSANDGDTGSISASPVVTVPYVLALLQQDLNIPGQTRDAVGVIARVAGMRTMPLLRGRPDVVPSADIITALSQCGSQVPDPHMKRPVMAGNPITCLGCLRGQHHICEAALCITVILPNQSLAQSTQMACLLLRHAAIEISSMARQRRDKLQSLWERHARSYHEMMSSTNQTGFSHAGGASSMEDRVPVMDIGCGAGPVCGSNSFICGLGSVPSDEVPSFAWLGTSRNLLQLVRNELFALAFQTCGNGVLMGQIGGMTVRDACGGSCANLVASAATAEGGGEGAAKATHCDHSRASTRLIARLLIRHPFVCVLLGPNGIKQALGNGNAPKGSPADPGAGIAAAATASVVDTEIDSEEYGISGLDPVQRGPEDPPHYSFAAGVGMELRLILWGNPQGPTRAQMEAAWRHNVLLRGSAHPASCLLAAAAAWDQNPHTLFCLERAGRAEAALDEVLKFATPSEEDTVFSWFEASDVATDMFARQLVQSDTEDTGSDVTFRGIDEFEADVLAAMTAGTASALRAPMRPPAGASSRTVDVHQNMQAAACATRMARTDDQAVDYYHSSLHDEMASIVADRAIPQIEESFSTNLVDYGPVILDFVAEDQSGERCRFTPAELLARRARWNLGLLRVGPSRIDGLGLFATRDIQKNDVIAEYQGQVVSHAEASRREKEYEQQGVADYMFRVGPDAVIDATTIGSAARYLNHSCEPNCYAINTLSAPERDSKDSVVGYAGNRLIDAPSGASFEPVPPHDPVPGAGVLPPTRIAPGEGLEALQPVRPRLTSPSGHAGKAAEAAGDQTSGGPGPKRGRLFFYAARDVSVGEELTYDYTFPTDEPPAPCRCGAPGCRGTLNARIPGTSVQAIVDGLISSRAEVNPSEMHAVSAQSRRVCVFLK